jgi:glycosyltransferase involved in cell wall biosynthesis
MSGRDLNITVKVLHVIKTLGQGGAEINLFNLVRSFDTAKVHCHVGYSGSGQLQKQFRSAGITLTRYAQDEHRVKSLKTFAIVRRLVKYIQLHQIDVVHTHNFSAHVWGLLASRLTRTPLIEHVHDQRYTPRAELIRGFGLIDQYKYARFLRNQADRVIVLNSRSAADAIRQRVATPERVVVLRNGIPLSERVTEGRGRIRQQLEIAPNAIVSLTCARIEPAKNIQLILRIAAAVTRAVPSFVFVVAGDGSHLDAYRHQCKIEGLESVIRLVGYRADIESLMAASDIFLLPSFLELHSIAVLEALWMQLPVVISSQVGCNDEMIKSGWNGYLCDPYEDHSWIITLTELANSTEARDRVGRNGRATCLDQFDIRSTAAKFEELYLELALGGERIKS